MVEDVVNSIALKGFYKPSDDSITINNKLSDSEKLATLSHEFAHALMHKTSTQSHNIVEFEAECLSHILQRRFNLPISDINKDYIATYYSRIKENELELDKSFQRISKAYNHAAGGLDAELAGRGIQISPEHGLEQSQTKSQAPQQAEKINQNFLQEVE